VPRRPALLRKSNFTHLFNPRRQELECIRAAFVAEESMPIGLITVKHHINTWTKKLNRLQATNNLVTPWQKEAIDSRGAAGRHT